MMIISANLEEFYLIINEDYTRPYLLSGDDSLRIAAGQYEFTVVHPQINDINTSVDLSSGEINRRRFRVTQFLEDPKKTSYDRILSYRSAEAGRDAQGDPDLAVATVSFSGDLEGAHAVVDRKYQQSIPLSNSDLDLSSGEHEIRVVHPRFNDIIFTVDMAKGESVSRHILLPKLQDNPPRSSFALTQHYVNTSIVTEPNGKIYVDGEYKGTGEMESFLIPGKHDLMISHPEHGDLESEFRTGLYDEQELARFNNNPNRPFTFRNLIPGYSYLNSDRKRLAHSTWAVMGVIGGFALLQNIRYNIKLDEYRDLRSQYEASQDRRQAVRLATQAQSKLNELDSVNRLLTYTMVGLAVTYTATTIHSLLKPSSGFTVGSAERGLSLSQGSSVTSIKLSYSF